MIRWRTPCRSSLAFFRGGDGDGPTTGFFHAAAFWTARRWAFPAALVTIRDYTSHRRCRLKPWSATEASRRWGRRFGSTSTRGEKGCEGWGRRGNWPGHCQSGPTLYPMWRMLPAPPSDPLAKGPYGNAGRVSGPPAPAAIFRTSRCGCMPCMSARSRREFARAAGQGPRHRRPTVAGAGRRPRRRRHTARVGVWPRSTRRKPISGGYARTCVASRCCHMPSRAQRLVV
jgi:hypothetical protein